MIYDNALRGQLEENAWVYLSPTMFLRYKKHRKRTSNESQKCYLCAPKICIHIMSKYNIIGDIHGRDSWRRLVDENCINVFVGDYFDPYEDIHFMDLQYNFMEIIEFKKKHPDNVVLLYGNHDFEYLPGVFEKSNRFDGLNAQTISWLLMKTIDLFEGVAYAIGEDYLVTHAGVTSDWKNTYLPHVADIKPSSMAAAINDLWRKDKTPFSFGANCYGNDFCGEDPHHSPIWVRPESLCLHNLYKGTSVKQIVGHTKMKEITEVAGVVLVDCLDTVEQSYKVKWP